MGWPSSASLQYPHPLQGGNMLSDNRHVTTGMRRVLRLQLEHRFGSLPEKAIQIVEAASEQSLLAMSCAVLDAQILDEVMNAASPKRDAGTRIQTDEETSITIQEISIEEVRELWARSEAITIDITCLEFQLENGHAIPFAKYLHALRAIHSSVRFCSRGHKTTFQAFFMITTEKSGTRASFLFEIRDYKGYIDHELRRITAAPVTKQVYKRLCEEEMSQRDVDCLIMCTHRWVMDSAEQLDPPLQDFGALIEVPPVVYGYMDSKYFMHEQDEDPDRFDLAFKAMKKAKILKGNSLRP